MKKVIMLVAATGMFGGAFAQQSTTVTQPVSAVVSNVCTYNVPDVSDVNGKTFTQGNKALGTSTALTTVNSSVAMGQFYIFRCTTGTSWDMPAYSKTGNILLTGSDTSNTGRQLNVTYAVNTSDSLDTANGDIHNAGVDFTIPAGQWSSKAGNYTGALTVNISYN